MQKAISEHFGTTPCGKSVEKYTLTNASGMHCKILTYGGTITEWSLLSNHGERIDTVLGFSEFNSYLGDHPHFGAIIGRVAGRITNGIFSLNGTEYQLEINDPPNHLHGGSNGLDKKIWQVEYSDRNNLTLSYQSPEERGYPGNVNFTTEYSLSETGELSITHNAKTDKATPINLTCHAYFNLNGAGDILDHELEIHAQSYAATNVYGTLLNQEPIKVTGSNTFLTPTKIRNILPHIPYEHGDLYFLNNPHSKLIHAATLKEPISGRSLTVKTTNPCLQLYLGKHISDQIIGKKQINYGAFSGLCLECQNYPDAVNKSQFGNIIIHPDQPYKQQTIYLLSN